MKANLIIIWAYTSEAIASTLLYALLKTATNKEDLKSFIIDYKDIIIAIFGIMLAAALSFLWSLYSKSDSPFSIWLHSKRAYAVYLNSFIYSSAWFLAIIIITAISTKTELPQLIELTIWTSIYCTILSITFIKNIYSKLLLNMEFNKIGK